MPDVERLTEYCTRCTLTRHRKIYRRRPATETQGPCSPDFAVRRGNNHYLEIGLRGLDADIVVEGDTNMSTSQFKRLHRMEF